MRKYIVFFILIILFFLLNDTLAQDLNNEPNKDFYSRNSIICNNKVACDNIPLSNINAYKINLVGCNLNVNPCNDSLTIWTTSINPIGNNYTGQIIAYLTNKFSSGTSTNANAKYYTINNCRDINTTVPANGMTCDVILQTKDNSGNITYYVGDSITSNLFKGNAPNCNVIGNLCLKNNANQTKNPKIVADPIDLNNKSVVDVRVDLKFPIEFSRIYNSKNNNVNLMGYSWISDADKLIKIPNLTNPNGISLNLGSANNSLLNTSWIQIVDGGNDSLYFYRNSLSNNWSSSSIKDITKLEIINNQFKLTKSNGDINIYDGTTGYIISENFKNGTYLNYYYNGTQLKKIINHLGQWIEFTYSNYANMIVQINASNGDIIQYDYINGYLTQVTYNSVETYRYNYGTNGLISDKYDENNQHYTHYDYDSNNLPTTNYMFDKDGNQINKTILNYSNNSYIAETKQNGNLIYHYFGNYDNTVELTSSLNISGGSGYYSITNKIYDTNGNITYDYNSLGSYTQYTYDSNNLITNIKKENGGNIVLTWDINKRLPLTITEQTSNGNRITTYTYDYQNNITSKTIQGNNETLIWYYTWSSDGRLLTKTQPNGLIYNYNYYPIDGTSSSGLLNSIITNTGKVVNINSYDIRGNATSITGIDGITKSMTYDIRSRLTSETVNGATNSYTYDLVGNLVLSTFANGYQLTMTYDPAHRLIKIEDNMNGMQTFILDSTTGKSLNTNTYQNNNLIKTLNQVLNTAGDTIKTYKSNINKAYNFGSLFKDGSVNGGQDPNNTNISRNIYNTGNVQNYTYAGDTVGYTYDYDDNIKTITTNNQITSYTYDDFGRLTQLVSPDTGTQNLSYNTVNGIKTRTDSNSITHTTTADIESKVTTITHSNINGTLTENYEYNNETKLKKITDNTGNTEYFYDSYGLLNKKVQTTNGKTFNILYNNNNLGQINSLTYPSGMTVNYTYNKGLLTNIYVNGTDIIKNVTYNSLEKQPVSWILGSNSVSITKNIDGAITNFTDNGMLNQTLTVDAMLNISAINDSINSNNNLSANFNTNYSIGNWSNTLGTQYHNSTSNFNISSITGNGTNNAWSYISGTNKVNAFTNSPTVNYIYDGNGNLMLDNKGTYLYDLKNNMISANRGNNSGTYYYNAMSQRVLKVVNGQLKYFVYNESNQLIGEYDSNGNIISEYIYFGLRPVAVKNNGNIYMVHTDYLGTPRYIMDNSNNLLWKWENTDPYGSNLAQGSLEFNLRFAGQYYDSESSLHYNIYRTYDPNAKRYMQSDPIGLAGGFNTYNYVGRNPLNNIDPLGLKTNKTEVQFYNCDALNLLIERERAYQGKIYNYFSINQGFPYNEFSISDDLTRLNASFDSIIGKVDGDYMLRIASAMSLNPIQSEGMYDLTYKEMKYTWNTINVLITQKGSFSMGMNEEGHKNSSKAAYLYSKGLQLKDLFYPAIAKCNQKCEKIKNKGQNE